MITVILISTSISVQSQVVESFDNVNTLESNGWIYDNRSDFPTKVFWAQGIESIFSAHSGDPTSYIFNTTASAGDLLCNWLIMPDVGNIEQLSFYTRSDNTVNDVTRMKVMYSPTGSINTGNCMGSPVKSNANETKGTNDYGDFQTLLTINQNQDSGAYPQDWTQYTVDVNGSGRIAFLYYVETGGPNFNSGLLAIDTINIGSGTIIAPQMIPSLDIFGLIVMLFIFIGMGIINSKQHNRRRR